MTVAPSATETTYALVGSNLGPFDTGFTYVLPEDVQAYLFQNGVSTQLSASDFTLTGLDPTATGGQVALTSGLQGTGWAADAQLTILRATARGQPSAFGDTAGFSPQEVETALDHVGRQVQEVDQRIDRSLSVGPGESAPQLPDVASRRGKIWLWGADGEPGVTSTNLSFDIDSVHNVESLTLAAASGFVAGQKFLRTAGRGGAGDGGDALWKRVDAAPALGGFRSTDRFKSDGSTDSVNGGYWKNVPEPHGANLLALGLGAGAVTLQNALDFSVSLAINRLKIPSGTYNAVAVQLGTTDALARGGLVIEGVSPASTTLNATGATPIFNCTPATAGFVAVRGPEIRDLTLAGQNVIRFNDKTATVTAAAMDSILNWRLINLQLADPGVTGTAIEVVKGFDGRIENVNIIGHDVGIRLLGCDLGVVTNGRVQSAASVAIEEISTGTFGSQNFIKNMDLLGAGEVFFRSCSRHVNFCDNYMEASSPGAQGFVDLTQISIPTFGANTPSSPQSIVMRGNRCEGQQNVSDYIYRIQETDDLLYLNLEAIPNTGPPTTATSYFCDSAGNPLAHIPLFPAGSNYARHFVINADSFGVWDGYRPRHGPIAQGARMTLTAECVTNFVPNFLGKGKKTHFAGPYIVLPAGSGDARVFIVPGSNYGDIGHNPYFTDGGTVSVTITARSTDPAADTVNVCLAGATNTGAGFGTAAQVFALTDQFKTFTFTTAGYPQDYQQVGLEFWSDTGVGDIYVSAITFQVT